MKNNINKIHVIFFCNANDSYKMQGQNKPKININCQCSKFVFYYWKYMKYESERL